jgi:hypothetical protein
LNVPAIAVKSQSSLISGQWNTRSGDWKFKAESTNADANLELDGVSGTRMMLTPGAGEFTAQGSGAVGQMQHNFNFTGLEMRSPQGVSRVNKGNIFARVNFGSRHRMSEDTLEFNFANFTLDYKTVSSVKDPFAPIPLLTEDLMDHLDRHSKAELDTAQCLTGPHKDDFTVSLSGIDLKAYGSQGQTRTAAISLKLAQRELMGREWGEEPVLLLDDVLSELDPGRQDFVLNQIVSGQVFITCCEPGRFTKLGKTIEIQKGKVVI